MPATLTNAAQAITGGFANPVFEAQAVFRQLMNAMANPGVLHAIETNVAPPAPLTAVAGALAATLFDHDTVIWLGPVIAREEKARSWLAFHTSAPLADQALDAHFAILADPGHISSFENFAQGTQEYPDRSTTLIVQLPSLQGGPALELTGPGIKDRAVIRPAGLPDAFPALWKANGGKFPRGVDLVLAGPDAIIGLPRTTREEAIANVKEAN